MVSGRSRRKNSSSTSFGGMDWVGEVELSDDVQSRPDSRAKVRREGVATGASGSSSDGGFSEVGRVKRKKALSFSVDAPVSEFWASIQPKGMGQQLGSKKDRVGSGKEWMHLLYGPKPHSESTKSNTNWAYLGHSVPVGGRYPSVQSTRRRLIQSGAALDLGSNLEKWWNESGSCEDRDMGKLSNLTSSATNNLLVHGIPDPSRHSETTVLHDPESDHPLDGTEAPLSAQYYQEDLELPASSANSVIETISEIVDGSASVHEASSAPLSSGRESLVLPLRNSVVPNEMEGTSVEFEPLSTCRVLSSSSTSSEGHT